MCRSQPAGARRRRHASNCQPPMDCADRVFRFASGLRHTTASFPHQYRPPSRTAIPRPNTSLPSGHCPRVRLETMFRNEPSPHLRRREIELAETTSDGVASLRDCPAAATHPPTAAAPGAAVRIAADPGPRPADGRDRARVPKTFAEEPPRPSPPRSPPAVCSFFQLLDRRTRSHGVEGITPGDFRARPLPSWLRQRPNSLGSGCLQCLQGGAP